jgi:ABC-type phosphate transport system substrate-binding protein
MKFNTTLLFPLMLAIALCLPCQALADVAVIVNKANDNSLNAATISSIFLGSTSRWESRSGIVIVQLPEAHAATTELNSKLLKKSAAEIRNIMSNNFFTGKSAMPKEAASDADVKRLVAGNKNAIGYINAAAVDNSVKVVLTVR